MNNLVDITINYNTEGLEITLDENITQIELNNDLVYLTSIEQQSVSIDLINPEVLITEVGCIPSSADSLLNSLIIGEIPQGLINGINATFTSLSPFIPASVEVYLNGVRQKIIDDYNTIGNNTIQFLISPTTNENILIDYIKL